MRGDCPSCESEGLDVEHKWTDEPLIDWLTQVHWHAYYDGLTYCHCGWATPLGDDLGLGAPGFAETWEQHAALTLLTHPAIAAALRSRGSLGAG